MGATLKRIVNALGGGRGDRKRPIVCPPELVGSQAAERYLERLLSMELHDDMRHDAEDFLRQVRGVR